MSLNYFYEQQSDQFSFYRIPKILFTDDRYKILSAEAKTLYGILLDWMNLSAKNGWMDENGRVYIIFPIEEIMESICFRHCILLVIISEENDKSDLSKRK
ncbi:MAG: replication initiator protein A [Clostridiales bacterium]|nr:replication initiator protein A [Clostridiales bacterium]